MAVTRVAISEEAICALLNELRWTEVEAATERHHALTLDIDVAAPEAAFKLLRECDEEIFSESEGGLLAASTLDDVAAGASRVRDAVPPSGKATLILVGSGTSGRLAVLFARLIQPRVRSQVKVVPVITGGPSALVRSTPNGEDSFDDAIADIDRLRLALDCRSATTIGISCGLSSRYVEGALARSQSLWPEDPHFLIGFNSKATATMDLASLEAGVCCLTPNIGAEPIAGSVRMKGGTATLVLLNALVSCIEYPDDDPRWRVEKSIRDSHEVLRRYQLPVTTLAAIVAEASLALRRQSRLWLLGSSGAGPLCVYDAAECPPTFGCALDTVQGFTEHGWQDLWSVDWPTAGASTVYQPSFASFLGLTGSRGPAAGDLAFVYQDQSCLFDTLSPALSDCKTVIFDGGANVPRTVGVHPHVVSLPVRGLGPFDRALALRTLLAHMSTVAFIGAGKVLHNTMIDLRITNQKLFRRAVRLVTEFCGISPYAATALLLRAIYQCDDIPAPILQRHVAQHILTASETLFVVPTAIVLARIPGIGVSEAASVVRREPVLRRLLADFTSS